MTSIDSEMNAPKIEVGIAREIGATKSVVR